MDYEKEYKKKLEDAKYWHDCSEGDIPAILEEIFSELKESSDEKIRKAISYAIANSTHEDGILINGVTESEAIAWLEKQGEVDNLHNYLYGEQKTTDKAEPKFKVWDFVVDNCGYVWKIEGILNQFYILEGVEGGESRPTIEWVDKTCHLWTIQDAKDGDVLVESKELDVILMFRGIGNTEWDNVIDYHCYYDCRREDFIVQKDFKYWGNTENNQLKPATKEQREQIFQKIKEAGYEWDAEKKELKKIEPKFKVGDWVVRGNITAQILDIQEQYYVGIDTNGNDFTSSRFLSDDKIHLWTIKDAKDGDVLCVKYGNDEMPFIFTGKQDDIAYCALNSFGEFVLSMAEWLLYTTVLPSTKEQRDLLFTKMKEAGYKWNDEKKELKIIDRSKHVKREPIDPSIIEQNPAWNEDDENMLKSIIATCELAEQDRDSSPARHLFEMQANWLKSLKERMKGE